MTNKALEVGKFILMDDHAEDELLTYAAAAECKMTHPTAKTILAKVSHLTLPNIDNSKYFPECRISAIEWWLSVIAKYRIKNLMIVLDYPKLQTWDGIDFGNIIRKVWIRAYHQRASI